MRLRYDYLNMLRTRVGAEGIPPEKLHAMVGRLEQARASLALARKDASLGFFDIPKAKPSARKMRMLLNRLDKEVDTVISVGIGGSALGAQAVLKALLGLGKPRTRTFRVVFAGDATDPQAIDDIIESVDWRRTAVNVISKSGGTLEPMSVFILFRDLLTKAVGKKKAASRIICTTDAEKGTLQTIAAREGHETLPVPENVGGRFSVMTEVGMFAAMAGGIDVGGLWKGAKEENDAFWKRTPMQNVPMLYAALQYLLYAQGKALSVKMPYVARLSLIGTWYRQLWAESLGKRVDRRGRVVHTGPTPIAAVGPADQHSQIQLYNEGPNDKVITFLEVDRFGRDYRLPDPYQDIRDVSYFAGVNFSEIVHAERQGTAEALTSARRPNGTLYMKDLTAESLGSYLQAMMCATAVMGELFDIDAFDQPGVESGKVNIKRLLGGGE